MASQDLGRLAVSFVVDDDPMFAYTGWHLAHSIAEHVKLPWANIHLQFTPEVPDRTIEEFRRIGCSTHTLVRFGDGQYCNKLAQLENLRGEAADHIVFLDTDMICIEDFSLFLSPSAVAGKVVDLDNPPLELLDELFDKAGFPGRPAVVAVEAVDAYTYEGNCNGGFYSVPKRFAEALFESWRRHAQSLLNNLEPLRNAGKENHVDQISFCMALLDTSVPFEPLPSNVNYYVHFSGAHSLRDASRPLAVLHYHNCSLNVLGLLEPVGAVQPDEIAAVEQANRQIRANFNTRLFWEMRYRHFPERGSGVGSRGENLAYKRELLRREGAEAASSVLDVGCGDLEVVHALDLHGYVGIDRSAASLARAAALRPDWIFRDGAVSEASPAQLVLCLEVAIHQQTERDYRDLIDVLAQKTQQTLIVSGYNEMTEAIASNHMLFFYEPLRQSLTNTGRFSSVREIGAHSDVVIYRCDVLEGARVSQY